MPTKYYGRIPERNLYEREKQFELQYLKPDEIVFNTFEISMLPLIAKVVEIHNSQISMESEKFRIINKTNSIEDNGDCFSIISKMNSKISTCDSIKELQNTLFKYYERKYSTKTRKSFNGLTIKDIRELYNKQLDLYNTISEMNYKYPMNITFDILNTLQEVILLAEEIINTYDSLNFDN